MQIATLGVPALTLCGALLDVAQIIAVIALRAHSTMDVIAGLFAALLLGMLF